MLNSLTMGQRHALPAKKPFVEGELLVRLKAEPSLHSEALLERYGATIEESFELSPSLSADSTELLRIQLPTGSDTEAVREQLSKEPGVAYAQTNDIYELSETEPNDLSRKLWGFKNRGKNSGVAGADIDAPKAWDITTGSEDGPIIAVLDTGVDLTHPDLKANLWTNAGEIPGNGKDDDGNGVIDDVHGYNAHDDSGDPQDKISHGTHVAGTIGARGNNRKGVVGVNWQTQLMPIKIFNDEGRTNAAAVIRGLNYAGKMGARITNNSWGGPRPNEAIKEAFAANEALHICAAGNSSRDTDKSPNFPSSYDLDNIVSVAASTNRDSLAKFSNYGATQVDVAAPGVDIYSTIPGPFWKRYDEKSGTSMATPIVAGVAGLVATAFPEAGNQELKDRLLYGSDSSRLLRKRVLTSGRVNAFKALEDDKTPPAALAELKIGELNHESAQLSWLATGDDGTQGTAGGYELKLQGERVYTARPQTAGETEAHALSIVPSEVERELAVSLTAVDNAGNRAPLQQLQMTVPAAQAELLEDFEGETTGWTADEPWGTVVEEGRGRVYTDSPEGRYENRHASSLTSPKIDLREAKDSRLVFDAKYELALFDGVVLQAKPEGAEEWKKLKYFHSLSDWKTHTVDISDYDGEQLNLRFQIGTNKLGQADGFYVDNFKVLSAPPS